MINIERGEKFLKKNQEEIQVVKIKTVADRLEEFKMRDNKIGMLIEITLIVALTAFCLFCFVTGMGIPVEKLWLSIEIVLVSVLFWFTFRIDRGSGYIFLGELILYGICGFCFRNEISQGLADIINIISEKIRDYYNVSFPLFQETGNQEQHMHVFLMFIVVMIAGMTAYIVVNKSAKFFLCIVQFPIALGSLLVGFLPECAYFLGYILSVAVLLTMPKQHSPYINGERVMQSMMVRTTALVVVCFAFFFGFLMLSMPKNRYETVNTTEYKDYLQERIQESFLGKIGGFGSGSSVGGLSHGQLGKTARLRYTGRKCLEINISGEIKFPLYLKSYVGEKYQNDHWESLSEAQKETESEAIGQMKNGEEQGAVWMELFSDMSDWFSEEAFNQYVETDISKDLYNNKIIVKHLEGNFSYGISAPYEDESSYSDIYTPNAEEYEDWSESIDGQYPQYGNLSVKGYAEGYSYKSIQAILGQEQTTIRVENIGLSPTENLVPYGRIISKDQKKGNVKSYTGYPNLNLYVKGGMEGYGYSSGNFIEGMLSRCWQSQMFLNECISHIPQKDKEKIQESDITLKELIDIVQEDTISIKETNGYYKMSGSYGMEYILYFKSGLKLKDVEEYIDKIWEYASDEDNYEAYVEVYKDAGEYASSLNDVCQKFQESSTYAVFAGSGNADIDLKYIGECINFVTEYLSDNMEYSLEPGKLPEGENFIDYYLFQQKKGYCSHFATIATNMFRVLGVPARYVEGFVVKQEDLPKGGASKNIQLEDKSAHAWVEIYVEGYGWVPVEVTPGYDDGMDVADFDKLLNDWNNINGEKNEKDRVQTPAPTKSTTQHQTTEQKQGVKSNILNAKTIKWIKTIATVIVVCGIVILLIWLRYVYVWKKRIRNHSYKLENGRVCNYYARMEALLKGIHAIEEADTFREILNTYIKTGKINQKKAILYMADIANKEQWTEFLEIINVAAYSSRDVSGHQLEIVRLLEERMRKEVFTSMPKIKMWYYQYIRLL